MPKKKVKKAVGKTARQRKPKLRIYTAQDLMNLKSSEAELIDASRLEKFYVCYPLEGVRITDATKVKFAYKLSEVMEQITK